MNNDSSTVRFRLEMPEDERSKLDAELPVAPTYGIRFDQQAHTISIRTIDDEKLLLTVDEDTSLNTISLQKKLANRSHNYRPDGEIKEFRYDKKGLLGKGGTSYVFEMLDQNIGRSVAVKILKDVKTPEDLTAFIHEGKLSARLEHPNIIPIYNLDLDSEGHVYLTMKKVEGHSLSTLIPEKLPPSYSYDELVLILLKVCDALSYAHSQNQVHQDIKPDNIMIGKYGEVFIIDWGSASPNNEELRISPIYMSPQQACGCEPDPRDDIYCLGASLFHVLTGKFPTIAPTLEELFEKKEKGIINLPEDDILKQIPKPLMKITLKALDPDQNKRYQDADELANDLKAWQRGFITSAEERTIATVLKLFLKRRWRESLVATLLIVLLGGLGSYQIIQGQKNRITQLQAEIESEKLKNENDRLEREREDRWEIIADTELGKGNQLPKQLRAFPIFDPKEDGIFLNFNSATKVLFWDEPIDSEIRIDLWYKSPGYPSLNVIIKDIPFTDDQPIGFGREFYMKYDFNLAKDRDEYGIYKVISHSPDITKHIHFDRMNHLSIWAENNTWHATINNQSILRHYDAYANYSMKNIHFKIHTTYSETAVLVNRIRVSKRRPARYVSVLQSGKMLTRSKKWQEARNFYLWQHQQSTYEDIRNEAGFLAARIPVHGDFSQQKRIDELKDIADNPKHPFQKLALHELVMEMKSSEWQQIIPLLDRVIKEAPELNTWDQIWPELHNRLQMIPVDERLNILTSLTKLPIRKLDISNLNLKDISFLSGSTITELILWSNPISDLSPLKGLNLNHLNIGKTKVDDLSELKNMNLRILIVSALSIEDLTALRGMNLWMLNAKNCPLIDFKGVENLNVKNLILDGSTIKNIQNIPLVKPVSLRIKNCNLKDLNFLGGYTPTFLNAANNQIADISALSGKTFQELRLFNNEISDISALKTTSIINWLDLNNNQIKDLSPLQNKSLTRLEITKNNIRDFSVLKSLTNLRSLSIEKDKLDSDTKAYIESLNYKIDIKNFE